MSLKLCIPNFINRNLILYNAKKRDSIAQSSNWVQNGRDKPIKKSKMRELLECQEKRCNIKSLNQVQMTTGTLLEMINAGTPENAKKGT
jgi:hypothetical protein